MIQNRSTNSDHTIGFIGLGRMGSPMAQRIKNAGHQLVLCDINPAVTNEFMDDCFVNSARAVADACEIVFSCLPTIDAFNETVLGKSGIAKGNRIKTYVHLGTTGVKHICEIADHLSSFGIDTVDAPISGGVIGAINGTLASMVSGSPIALIQVKPLIECYSKIIVEFGDKVGAAQAVKLINNTLSNTNLLAAIEGIEMGVKAGIDPDQLVKVVMMGTGGSRALETMVIEHVMTKKFAWGGPLQIIKKDLEAWQLMANELKVECALNRTASDIFLAGIDDLGVHEDITAIAKYIQKKEKEFSLSAA